MANLPELDAKAFWIRHDAPEATTKLAETLQMRAGMGSSDKDIVVVCIGSDLVIGDALGPVVGSLLSEMVLRPNVHIYGTLESPVTASNIQETVDRIGKKHDGAYIIAVDSILSRANHVGMIMAREGPIKPGSGVGKDLILVGDFSVCGATAKKHGGPISLYNVRFGFLLKMARVIACGLATFLNDDLGQTTATAVHRRGTPLSLSRPMPAGK